MTTRPATLRSRLKTVGQSIGRRSMAQAAGAVGLLFFLPACQVIPQPAPACRVSWTIPF